MGNKRQKVSRKAVRKKKEREAGRERRKREREGRERGTEGRRKEERKMKRLGKEGNKNMFKFLGYLKSKKRVLYWLVKGNVKYNSGLMKKLFLLGGLALGGANSDNLPLLTLWYGHRLSRLYTPDSSTMGVSQLPLS